MYPVPLNIACSLYDPTSPNQLCLTRQSLLHMSFAPALARGVLRGQEKRGKCRSPGWVPRNMPPEMVTLHGVPSVGGAMRFVVLTSAIDVGVGPPIPCTPAGAGTDGPGVTESATLEVVELFFAQFFPCVLSLQVVKWKWSNVKWKSPRREVVRSNVGGIKSLCSEVCAQRGLNEDQIGQR